MPGKKMSNSAKSKATRSRKETETDEKPKKKGQPENNKFPMVCLGASAGGLKAIEAFLSSLPRKSGIAFVVISPYRSRAGQPAS